MPKLIPQTPLQQRIHANFQAQNFLSLIGAELTLVEPGRVVIEMPFDVKLTQQHQALHAGATSTIADTAAGYAALTTMPEGADVMTVEFKINLMAPGRGNRFKADARAIRTGRTVTVVEARVSALQDSGIWVETASFLGTMICLMPKQG
jgi:uncharacterized protein (TIGR00369 family)